MTSHISPFFVFPSFRSKTLSPFFPLATPTFSFFILPSNTNIHRQPCKGKRKETTSFQTQTDNNRLSMTSDDFNFKNENEPRPKSFEKESNHSLNKGITRHQTSDKNAHLDSSSFDTPDSRCQTLLNRVSPSIRGTHLTGRRVIVFDAFRAAFSALDKSDDSSMTACRSFLHGCFVWRVIPSCHASLP